MFEWNKKEAPLKALAGLGGGVGRGGGESYPILSQFTDSSDGRYDARIFISGNDGNILDWQRCCW